MLKVAVVLVLVPIVLGVNVMELMLNGTLINLTQVQGNSPRLDINIQLNKNSDCGNINSCASSGNMRDCSCMGHMLATHPYGFNAVIKPDPNQDAFDVYCYVVGTKIWTVIQERIESNEHEVVTFNRPYAEYENGFGVRGSNFWLGLKRIRMLTEAARMSMRMVIHNATGMAYWGQYDVMQVDNAAHKYALTVSGHTGNIGSSIVLDSNSQPFSANDQDNGANGCPGLYKAGWWYAKKSGADCVKCTPNGPINDTLVEGLACDLTDGSQLRGRHTFLALAPRDYIEA